MSLPSTPLTPQQLEQAFVTFNQVSSELDASYRILQTRVAALTAELNEARSQRLQELAEKEQLANRLELLMDALPGAVVVLDTADQVQEANREASNLLGVNPANCKWQDILDRITQVSTRHGQDLVLRDGRRLSLTQRALSDGDERLILITDVTELHALQDAVNREKRLSALGEMAARLAHQVRTPLSSALLYMSPLCAAELTNSERTRIANKVLDRLRHMESLVDSLLSFVRGSAVKFEAVTLTDLTRDVVDVVAPLIDRAGGSFSTPAEIPDMQVVVVREALVGAVLNLITNAAEAGEGKNNVTLQLKNEEKNIVFCVSDDGPGITEDLRDRIFDPFFTTRPLGTGLGLAVVAMTARAHGGAINVRSNAGGGALFELAIPIRGGGGAQRDATSHKRYENSATHPITAEK